MPKKKIPEALQLFKSAADFILAESRGRAPHETGGILVGKMQGKRLLITHAIGPGTNANHGPSGFKRDGRYSQKELDKIFSATKGEEDYVGEWHSHPIHCEASSIDAASMAWISESSRYNCSKPVLIVSVPSEGKRWELLGYKWSKSHLVRCTIKLIDRVVSDGHS